MEGFFQRKKSAQHGRRTKKPVEKGNIQETDSGHTLHDMPIIEDDGTSKPGARPGADSPPKRGKRTGGWGEERKGSAEMEDERLKMRTPPDSDGSDTEIPVIPNLEEGQEEEINATVAMAPTVAVNRVATYRELDNDLLQHAQFMTLDNEVDLKLLGKCLSNEVEIKEEDKPWDWDRLFTEVTSELLTEWAGEDGQAVNEADQEAIGMHA